MAGKKIVNAKKVKAYGIEFQSDLEYRMYLLLKQANIEFIYEGKSYTLLKPITLNYSCYERPQKKSKEMKDRRNVRAITYTPDFVGKNEGWIIEVKGRANERFPVIWKLFKSMMSRRKKPPMIFKPTNIKDCKQVIEILIKNGYAKK